MKRVVAAALVVALCAASHGAEGVPSYELPAGFVEARLDHALEEAARAAVATILDPASPGDAADAARILAGLGRGALPHAVRALSGAPWYARAELFSALAEIDAPDATPLFVAACRDPAFSVREAAVAALGKTGDARGAAALIERSAESSEPAWRVRIAAATALRRAVLRGAVERRAGEAALVALLEDPDDDARRAALRELAPLAADAALPALLAIFQDPRASSGDRTLALGALRAFRTPHEELIAALRHGFLSGGDESTSDEAGRALLALRGVAALDDEVSAALVHRLHESEHAALRGGLARIGRPAVPWLRERALELARRIGAGRATHQETSFDELLDTLVQVDESAALEFTAEILGGAESDTFDRETRLAVLRKVELAFAPRLAVPLRSLFDSRPKDDLRPDILRAIVASGGDDLAERLDRALGDARPVRLAALELLGRRPDLPAGPGLVALAREAADVSERCTALETLSRRAPEEAARIAAPLLDDPHAAVRSKAVTVLSASRDPADFERLLGRLAKEDGGDAPPAKSPDAPKAGPAQTTPSERASGTTAVRRALARALLGALRTSGAERARPALLRCAASDTDAVVREAAAKQLTGLATAADGPTIAAMESAEPDVNTRRELLRLLAAFPELPEATARFEKLVANPRSRGDALALLGEPAARVVPASLVAGVSLRDWSEEERRLALVILDRAGRGPGVDALASIVAGAATMDLCGEAARSLANRREPEAVRALVLLLTKVEDADRLAEVVQALGARGAPEAEAPLLELFDTARERAFASRYSSDPAVELYRRCAEAVAEFGSDKTGDALVAHLFDVRLARSGARFCTAGGSFVTEEAAAVAIVRTLVAALTRRDEPACRRLVAARLAAIASTGREFILPETYAAAVARYLRDPLAFGLPARPRPAAAAELWSLVVRAAPRLSECDLAAYEALDERFGEDGRYREAAAALRAFTAVSDVEDAARPRDDRLVETCRADVRSAQALFAEGRGDEAVALARKLRAPDPASSELAYRQGWCLAHTGHADAEAKDALRFAAAQDDKDPRIHFQLAWIAEKTEGPRQALRSYLIAIRLDQDRSERRTAEDSEYAAQTRHETGAYQYWYARALRACGSDDEAAKALLAAVRLDDRCAGQASTDPAFAGWDRLEAAVTQGLAEIRRGALR